MILCNLVSKLHSYLVIYVYIIYENHIKFAIFDERINTWNQYKLSKTLSEMKTHNVRLTTPTYEKVAKLGNLGRKITFDDVIAKCVDIAMPKLLSEKQVG